MRRHMHVGALHCVCLCLYVCIRLCAPMCVCVRMLPACVGLCVALHGVVQALHWRRVLHTAESRVSSYVPLYCAPRACAPRTKPWPEEKRGGLCSMLRACPLTAPGGYRVLQQAKPDARLSKNVPLEGPLSVRSSSSASHASCSLLGVLRQAEQRAAAANEELRKASGATEAEMRRAAAAERKAEEAMQALELVSMRVRTGVHGWLRSRVMGYGLWIRLLVCVLALEGIGWEGLSSCDEGMEGGGQCWKAVWVWYGCGHGCWCCAASLASATYPEQQAWQVPWQVQQAWQVSQHVQQPVHRSMLRRSFSQGVQPCDCCRRPMQNRKLATCGGSCTAALLCLQAERPMSHSPPYPFVITAGSATPVPAQHTASLQAQVLCRQDAHMHTRPAPVNTGQAAGSPRRPITHACMHTATCMSTHTCTHTHSHLLQAKQRAAYAETELSRATGLSEQRARAAEKRAADAQAALERAERRAAAADAELASADNASEARARAAEKRAADATAALEQVGDGAAWSLEPSSACLCTSFFYTHTPTRTRTPPHSPSEHAHMHA